MPSHPTSVAAIAALAAFGFGACKTIYSDAFSHKKNAFQAPPERTIAITAPAEPIIPLGGGVPADAGGLAPIPGIPEAMPDGAVPGVPGAAPAPDAPAVPGAAPAIPGLN